VEDDRDAAAATLQKTIILAFPPTTFRGGITPADGEAWAAEIDDDLDLRDKLSNRAWNEVTAEVIGMHAADLPLLTPEAFAAFLPAWLMHSLEDLSGDNKVRDFTVQEFCRHDAHPTLQEHQRIRHALLNAEQRKAVVDFLVLVSNRERDQLLRACAAEALSSFRDDSISPSGFDKRS
jgi:hypothetical protein